MSYDILILINLVLKTEADYQNFRYSLEKSLSTLSIAERKKLLICATELIQNNYIHNNANDLKISIYQNSQQTIIESTQFLIEDDVEKIKKRLQLINKTEIQILKKQKIENIQKSLDKLESSPGNGLIVCRITSGNTIDFRLVCKEQEIFQTVITIKTDKHGKDY
jgi:hypothetical protein